MTRAVSVLEVAEPAVWAELAALAPVEAHFADVLGPTKRVVKPSFEREILPKLTERGASILLRWARAEDRVQAASTAPETAIPLHSTAVARPMDYSEAIMPETADLGPSGAGPVTLLHDMASLAACVERCSPKRTVTGTVAKVDVRRLAVKLAGSFDDLEQDPRWGRALRGLEALRVVSMDPATRALHLDLGLEAALAGDTADAIDHLGHRLVDPELHAVFRAIREALRQASSRALDELVLFELIGQSEEDPELFEGPLVPRLMGLLSRLGLIRRAPGVIAATVDGRVWARAVELVAPPVWVTSDLEVIVAPNAVTPWERFQIERLGCCLSRDVVDRYRLERVSLATWLSTHEIDDALDLLARRCPALPVSVQDTLRAWTRSATRIVLTRGVLIPTPR